MNIVTYMSTVESRNKRENFTIRYADVTKGTKFIISVQIWNKSGLQKIQLVLLQ